MPVMNDSLKAESDPASSTSPGTNRQFYLLNLLVMV